MKTFVFAAVLVAGLCALQVQSVTDVQLEAKLRSIPGVSELWRSLQAPVNNAVAQREGVSTDLITVIVTVITNIIYAVADYLNNDLSSLVSSLITVVTTLLQYFIGNLVPFGEDHLKQSLDVVVLLFLFSISGANLQSSALLDQKISNLASGSTSLRDDSSPALILLNTLAKNIIQAAYSFYIGSFSDLVVYASNIFQAISDYYLSTVL